jgi:HNH endonuclease
VSRYVPVPDYGTCTGSKWSSPYETGSGTRPRKAVRPCRARATANGRCRNHGGVPRDFVAARCLRCGSVHELHKHHVVRVDDGGDDTPENLAWLCGECHREWHWNVESSIPFETYVRIPPTRWIAALLAGAPEAVLLDLRQVCDAFDAWKSAHYYGGGALPPVPPGSSAPTSRPEPTPQPTLLDGLQDAEGVTA